MAAVVYILCALTSAACSALLLRGYFQKGVRLLLWSGLCFAGLALNNIVIIFDALILPDVDLSLYRNIPALIGLLLLIYGLIWEVN